MASARFIAGVGLSAGLHVLAFVQMSHAKASAPVKPPPVVIEIDNAPPPPPPPSAVTPTPETKEEPAPLRAAKTTNVAKPRPAAQAGKVLAAKDDAQPSAMADFTMVQGEGASYAGGVTTSNGTARVAASAVNASPVAPAGGTGGKGTSVTARDLSKPARPAADSWDCSALFPSSAGVDTATVVIVVRVGARGAAESVSVVKEPGQGFGAAARACAMKQRYAAAEDREGNPVAATTSPFRVRFTR